MGVSMPMNDGSTVKSVSISSEELTVIYFPSLPRKAFETICFVIRLFRYQIRKLFVVDASVYLPNESTPLEARLFAEICVISLHLLKYIVGVRFISINKLLLSKAVCFQNL